MKKLILMFLVSIMSMSVFALQWEVGPRVGYRTFSEDDLFGDGTSFGLQGSLYVKDNMRVRVVLDMFSSDEISETTRYQYRDSWTETKYDKWTTEDEYFIYYWSSPYTVTHYIYYYVDGHMKSDFDINPIYFEYDYIWNLGKFDIFVGGGLGFSMNKMSISERYTGVSEKEQALANALNNNTSYSGDLKDCLIYGISVGGTYNINDNWSASFEINYTGGQADMEITYTAYNRSTTFKEKYDLNNTNVFASVNYKIGKK